MQGFAQFLLRGSVSIDQARVGVFDHAVGRGNRASNFRDDHFQLGSNVRINAIQRLTRILECLIQRNQHFRQIGPDRFLRQFFQLGHDPSDFGFEILHGAWNDRNLWRVPGPVDVNLGRSWEEVEGNEELSR